MLEMGLVLARLVIGLVAAAHGSQKLFGWFGGAGMPGFTKMMEGLQVRPARLWAMVAALTETLGGLMLALGLLTPIVAAALFGNFVVAAVVVHMSKGFWSQKGGYEYPMVLSAMCLALAVTGPGAVSIDGLLGLPIQQPVIILSALMTTLAVTVGLLEARHLAVNSRSRQTST
jgi:putative oxidoreductase